MATKITKYIAVYAGEAHEFDTEAEANAQEAVWQLRDDLIDNVDNRQTEVGAEDYAKYLIENFYLVRKDGRAAVILRDMADKLTYTSITGLLNE